MKTMTSEEFFKGRYEEAMKICNEYLGENCEYSKSDLKKIIKNCNKLLDLFFKNNKVKTEGVTAGGGVSKVNATTNTKFFREVNMIARTIETLLEIIDGNKIKLIKGFNFTEEQIEKGNKYRQEQFNKKN